MSDKILGNLTRGELLEVLKKQVSATRFEHILGVEEMTQHLCTIHDGDIVKCRTAALFHDFAKSFKREEALEILRQNGYIPDAIEEECFGLLHGKVAAFVAKNRYEVTDEETFSIIFWHTTGHENMSKNEKILFVSDALERGRKYEGVDALRELADMDLDLAMKEIIDNQIRYVLLKKELLHPDTVLARNYLYKQRGEI